MPAPPNRTTGAAPAPTCEAGAPDAAPWGYEAHNGPARWGTLDPAFQACDLGEEQSPIDLTGGRSAVLEAVEFDYRRTRVAIENTGRTIQVNPEPGSRWRRRSAGLPFVVSWECRCQ